MSGKSTSRWHEERAKRGERVHGGWFVFRRGQTTGRIKIDTSKMPFEHPSRERAVAEAVRLSAANPGIDYCVFNQVISFREPRASELEATAEGEAQTT